MSDTKVFMMPLVAAVIALGVRLAAYHFRDLIPLPYHFGITTPNTAAETWKEVLYWKQQFGTVPEYLLAIAPWYAEYIPPAPPAAYALTLCLCDALTAFIVSRWPSATPQLLYTLLVLNPMMIVLPALESLAPLENLAIAVVLECCRSRRGRPWLMLLARILAPALSFFFVAVILALWIPLGLTNAKSALITGLLGAAGVGGFGLLYLQQWGALHSRNSLYSPPDNGVMWYVRLLIIPSFSRCIDVFQVQFPAVLTLPLAVAMPPAEAGEEDTGAVPTDRRLLLVLFAVCASLLFRHHLVLADYTLAVLFMYSLLAKSDGATGAAKSMFERAREQNIFVPVYTLLLVVPLQYGFYTGWVMWDTANPNWVFFPQVAFVVVGIIFLLMFVSLAAKVIQSRGRAKVKEA